MGVSAESHISLHLLGKGDAFGLLELIHESLSCVSEADFRRLMEKLRLLMPYDYALCGIGDIDKSGVKENYSLLNLSYPSEWLELYVINKFAAIDPIVKENFSRYDLQYWQDTYRRHNPQKEFVGLAEDFGLRDGITIGLRNLKGTKGSLISLSSNRMERSARSEAIIKLAAPHLHNALSRMLKLDGLKKKVALSLRETEVLKWMRQGKSTWDISVILGVSASTVKFHVANIMQKLDVVTRAQAVAVAFEIGLLDPE